MKIKNKGRKIYKTKEKNFYGKSIPNKIFSAGLTVLFLSGVVFLGYSVAEPIMNYTKKKGDNSVPIVAETSSSESSYDMSSSLDSSVNFPDAVSSSFYCASLASSDLTSENSLISAVSRLSSNSEIEYVMVPLKVKGGKLNYASKVNNAVLSGAVQSTLELSKIVEVINDAGYKPVAYLSILNDNIYPQTYPDAGYRTIGDGSRWLDNSLENGGKPWLSPFSDECKSYISSIVSEVTASGFANIVCGDVVFPPFRESDLSILDEKVNDSERYLALTSLVNSIYSDSVSAKCPAFLEVSAADLVSGKADVFQPMLLQVSTVIININMEELAAGLDVDGMYYEFKGSASDNIKKILGLLDGKFSDFNVAIRVSGTGVENADAAAIKNAINESGYKSFVLR